jgi:hypothetical protein
MNQPPVDLGGVLPSECEHGAVAARMAVQEVRHVQHAAVDNDPQVLAAAVRRHVRDAVRRLLHRVFVFSTHTELV